MSDPAIFVAEHQSCDDALDDLIAYRQLYPRRRFELELCDDGRPPSWRVILRISRRRPWQRWTLPNRAPW